MAAGAAAAVTLAHYESGASSGIGLTGVRRVDGEPVGTDAVLPGGGDGGGEYLLSLDVQDADGNDVSPVGIAEVTYDGGSLFDAGYKVIAGSDLFDYYKYYSFENVSEYPVYAALGLEGSASAEAFSTVSTARVRAGGADSLYIQTAAGDTLDAAERLLSETITALTSICRLWWIPARSATVQANLISTSLPSSDRNASTGDR